jgi:hypothetical protein
MCTRYVRCLPSETEESLARNVNARAQTRGEDETTCVHDSVPAFLPSSVRPAPFKRHVAGEELSANTIRCSQPGTRNRKTGSRYQGTTAIAGGERRYVW